VEFRAHVGKSLHISRHIVYTSIEGMNALMIEEPAFLL
jgi:hypothetical protein